MRARGGSDGTMEAEVMTCPPAKKCQRPRELGRSKDHILLSRPLREIGPTVTSTTARWCGLQTLALQTWDRTQSCCCQPSQRGDLSQRQQRVNAAHANTCPHENTTRAQACVSPRCWPSVFEIKGGRIHGAMKAGGVDTAIALKWRKGWSSGNNEVREKTD